MEFNDRRVAWKSAWPEGHENYTVDATGAQQRMDKQAEKNRRESHPDYTGNAPHSGVDALVQGSRHSDGSVKTRTSRKGTSA